MDGRLTHHGRLDFQVKIRGFRIELGEIENVLKQIDGITDAVVLVKTTADNDQKLVAYVTGHDIEMAGLKRLCKSIFRLIWCQVRLSDWMSFQ